jgi:hypothetical protein
MKRKQYPDAIIAMAARVAALTMQQRGVQMHTRCGRFWISRTIQGEGMPILRNARSWRTL